MEISALRTFAAVAKAANFAQAARVLNLSPSALTRRIQELEDELGVALFERDTRTVSLTHAGRRLLEDCGRILNSISRTSQAVRIAALRGNLERLTISVPPSLCQRISALLVSFGQDHPEIAIEFRHDRSGTSFNARDGQDAAVGLTREDVREPKVKKTQLFEERLAIVLPKTHPAARQPFVALADLQDEVFLTYPADSSRAIHEATIRAFATAGYRPRLLREIAEDDLENCLFAVETGRGLMVATDSFATFAQTRQSLTAIPIREDVGRIQVRLLSRDERDPMPIRELQSHLRRLYASQLRGTGEASDKPEDDTSARHLDFLEPQPAHPPLEEVFPYEETSMGVVDDPRLTLGLSAQTIAWWATYGEVVNFAPGEYLVHEGDLRPDMFVLLEGAAKIEKEVRGRPFVLALAKEKGHFIADAALITGLGSGASVTAESAVTALRIPRSRFFAAMFRAVPVRENLLTALVMRARDQDSFVRQQEKLDTVWRLADTIHAACQPPLSALRSYIGAALNILAQISERTSTLEERQIQRDGPMLLQQLKGMLQGAQDSAGSAEDVVRSLARYTTRPQEPPRPVLLEPTLEDAFRLLAPLPEGVRLDKAFVRPSPSFTGYGDEMVEVWHAILDNALDAVRGSGRIEIATQLDGNYVAVSIADSGSGIPAEIQHRVFEPLFTTKSQGLGLGLDNAYRIVVRRHAGTIRFTSVPGRTTFLVRLPLAALEATH